MIADAGRLPLLTEEQQAVVDVPADSRVLVTAEAGAGKTTTLIARIARLVAEEDVEPHELLVLSFSRAAVRTLQERLRLHGERTGAVRARTFDSWALEILVAANGIERWRATSFDARIRAVAEGLLDEDSPLGDQLHDVSHVVVDEVQDLVGVRRQMVTALVRGFDALGFTMVGDAAQSIYGFQITDPTERARETNAFFESLRGFFATELVELSLTDNFRARTEDASRALRYGPLLRSSVTTAAPSGLYEDLRTELMEAMPLGDPEDDFTHADLRDFHGTTAILCRTNGEALLVSEHLRRGDVPHGLRRGAESRGAPGWLVDLFDVRPGAALNRDRFDALPRVGDRPPPELWRLLLKAAGDRGGRSIDLGRLRLAIAESRLPDELVAEAPTAVIVSSFHRAKGLEFDRVVVADPGAPHSRGEDFAEAEEARLLYVAMTRARDEMLRLDSQRSWWLRLDPRVDRWARYGHKRWQRHGLEFDARDTAGRLPPGAESPAEVAAVQRRLASQVRPGDAVRLERVEDDVVLDGAAPPYRVVHESGLIGLASDDFRSVLYRHLQQRLREVPYAFPRTIENVRVEGVQAVAGADASISEAGLNDHGVWRAPRLTGLSRFVYDKKDDVA